MNEDLPGELGRRYTEVQELGSGAFGRVVKAHDSVLGRPVALKILNAFRTTDPEARARFEREAALFSRLASPHLPRVYDFGVVDGIPHIVFELLAGESLARRLQTGGGRLPPEDVRGLVDQLLAALEVLHGARILHRDLKPDNVLLLQDGGLALIDLGLGVAPDSETLTKTGAAVGTPAYLAPDLMTGGKWSESSDLYALALIGLQALWGRLPLAGPTLMETLEIRRAGPGRWMKAEGLALDPPWIQGLVAALAADPDRRPHSVGELRESLRAGGAAPPARTGPGAEPRTALPAGRPRTDPGTRSSREPRPARLPAAALGALVAGLGGLALAARPWLGSTGTTGTAPRVRAHAIEEFRLALEADPAIAAALDLTSATPDVEARSLWHRARAAYRRLVEQHELRETLAPLGPAELDRALAVQLGRILLIESMLSGASRKDVPPLFEGEAPSGVEASLLAAVRLRDAPDLAGGADPVLPEGMARIEASLARDGASFSRIYTFRSRPDFDRLPIRHQTRVRTVDPRGRPHTGWFTGEASQMVFGLSPLSAESFEKFPFSIGCELAPVPGDLVLAFDTQGLTRDRPGWLEIAGGAELLALPLLPAPAAAPAAPLAPGQEPHQLFLVRIPQSLLPERAASLRLSAIGIQPTGPPDPLVGLWHIWMQTGGPPRAELADSPR